jgi:hypothetical protein
MSYALVPLVVFLAVLFVGGIALIADAGIRLLRGQLLRLRAIALALRGR